VFFIAALDPAGSTDGSSPSNESKFPHLGKETSSWLVTMERPARSAYTWVAHDVVDRATYGGADRVHQAFCR
jgi:hypothetical protein